MIGSLKRVVKEPWIWRNQDLLNIIWEYADRDEKLTLYQVNESLRTLVHKKFPLILVDPLFTVWFIYSDSMLSQNFNDSPYCENLISRKITRIQFLQYHEGDIIKFKQRLLKKDCIFISDIKATLGWEAKADFNAKYITPKAMRGIIQRYKDNKDLDPTIIAIKDRYNLSNEWAHWLKWFKDGIYTTV
ncbi:MAG: hypothetical protein COZ46_05440 [Verrucomicrobia bacterium CG_4_10_14_3_um_filter_43_23]|nr:MAG: hypothetical protein AUJ82_05800 [Verrucomicrobia bacterium CG1_02_43_26]PIP60014.1 MAG: hypothetical protein COX01_00175 [Verrucomicrobia bacterium CG22_combo_CG10-13_8_21_14_all_43_17]PIX58132.1 MAG: hypothetical protein COZ46_05440 [Verrucomicrobia bacterium CG_4_10_14_3_um_filter_43_23]PIY60994.1 MAG: hypothetical protein COY94_07640 [Verrucomicrobia bacterium CG_4_10_14_0_8_um_filter_43_34]PJA43572.1 MAG: hypothetical protein CO175_07360 [Verrucomicrobia bacterium CG_4_9_14_3_um_fi